jgi:hypothetical protein
VTTLGILLLTAGLVGQPTSACPEGPTLRVELSTHSWDVSVSGESTLVHLNELSARSRQGSRHKPLGFSVLSFHYTVRSGPVAGCPDQVSVGVDVVLDGKRIEVAREVMASKYLGPVAVAHYRRHADADYEAFAWLTARVGNTLRSPAFREAKEGVVDTIRAEKIVVSAVDGELAAYDRCEASSLPMVSSGNACFRALITSSVPISPRLTGTSAAVTPTAIAHSGSPAGTAIGQSRLAATGIAKGQPLRKIGLIIMLGASAARCGKLVSSGSLGAELY